VHILIRRGPNGEFGRRNREFSSAWFHGGDLPAGGKRNPLNRAPTGPTLGKGNPC
jgi:hypothetical protein